MLLKEQQYLTKVARLEDQLKKEASERQERHERVTEALRQKHQTLIEQKNDEIADLSRKLSDAEEQGERNRMDRDSLREEVNKLQDQWRSFKEDTSMKYESYNKQLNQQEAMSEEKVKGLQRENEKLREDIEAMREKGLDGDQVRKALNVSQKSKPHKVQVETVKYMLITCPAFLETK